MNQRAQVLVPIEVSEAEVIVQRIFRIAAILSQAPSAHEDEPIDDGSRGENQGQPEIRYADTSHRRMRA